MSQKFENLLNLALETDEEERERTGDLNVGYHAQTKSWELIVKYHGTLSTLEELGIGVEELIAGYAILTVPEQLVDTVGELEQIEYVEKPKRYFYSMEGLGTVGGSGGNAGWLGGGNLGSSVLYSSGRTAPRDSGCFAGAAAGLKGSGVLIAVLDSGIEWARKEFQTEKGKTRILSLWDQTLEREFSAEQINEALAAAPQEQFRLIPSVDGSGHGTAVAGIAAGSRTVSNGLGEIGGSPVFGGTASVYEGVASQAELLIVKLGVPDEAGFPRTVEIIRGVTWALRKALERNQPLVINLSFGNSYGSHDGSSLLERFLDNAAEIGRTVICVGSGNEGAGNGHVAGRVPDERQIARNAQVELAVGSYERNLRVQLWQNYSDVYRILLRSPGGVQVELTAPVEQGKFTVNLGQTRVLAYQGEPLPYSVAKELYLEFLPENGSYIESGIWTFLLEPVRIVTGQYYFYLSDSVTRSAGTFFYRPTPEVTLTIPSAASKVLTVGAYDSIYDAYADFSGRGYADRERTIGVVTAGLVKPDIVAPGVNILAPDRYGGYTTVTGTSFATPIAAGAAALLMEWGIVRGNDLFLYGEKVKAYLRKGASALRGESVLPNDRVGFGKLCMSSSLPG